MKNGGGGAPENKLLNENFLGFALGLLRFKKINLPCHPEDEIRRIFKKNERGILRFAQNDKKCAFTLAEVLITLGIIGIVAAMTLPTLINKSQQMILKNQFKKSYSTLSQAYNKSIADLEYKPSCYYNLFENSSVSGYGPGDIVLSDCAVLKDALFKNLNIVQTCKGEGYQKGCIPKYQGVVENLNMSYSDINEKNYVYNLADGSILISSNDKDFLNCYYFAVDVNGKKGPNKWGYDLFEFLVGSNKSANYILVGGRSPVEEGGKTTMEMLQELYNKKND